MLWLYQWIRFVWAFLSYIIYKHVVIDWRLLLFWRTNKKMMVLTLQWKYPSFLWKSYTSARPLTLPPSSLLCFVAARSSICYQHSNHKVWLLVCSPCCGSICCLLKLMVWYVAVPRSKARLRGSNWICEKYSCLNWNVGVLIWIYCGSFRLLWIWLLSVIWWSQSLH